MGGAGRANGLGGPDAPAESRAFVEGDGGGRTTPGLAAGAGPVPIPVPAVVVVSFGDESPVALPPSDCSLGICTFSRGRLASDCIVLARDGSGMLGTEDDDAVRWGGRAGNGAGGGFGDAPFALSRDMAATSIDCDLGPSTLIVG